MEREDVLEGGRLTPGVVRVGDTVRRPAGLSSAFVGRLLCHLEREGFEGAPRYLGRDGEGRDVLSYLPGWVPARFQRWSDEQVAAIGALLRRYHEATLGLAGGPDRVVCHHDAGPNNAVFRDGLPYALIDFDHAAPGRAVEDLGYAAWTWCVSSNPAAPPVGEQARQVRVLVDAYREEGAHGGDGACQGAGVVDAMLERQLRNAWFWRGFHAAGGRAHQERVAWSAREHAFVEANRAAFTQPSRP